MLRAMASLPSVAHVDVGEQVCLGGQRRGLRLGDRPVDQRPDLGVDRVEVRAGQFAGLGYPADEALEAVEFGPRVLDLAGPVGLLVALEVPEVAGELHLDERRPAALPGPGDRLAGRLVYREE